MLEAVEHVHQMGYVHQDIKCDNFLLDEYANIKLCDFGMAEKYDSQAKENMTVISKSHAELPSGKFMAEIYLFIYFLNGWNLWQLSCCCVLHPTVSHATNKWFAEICHSQTKQNISMAEIHDSQSTMNVKA